MENPRRPPARILLSISITAGREYKVPRIAYVPRIDNGRRCKTVDIVVHYPEDKEKQRELARRAAGVHAQTVAEKLAALSCPLEQKMALFKEIKQNYEHGEMR